jgi:hypothetical protein
MLATGLRNPMIKEDSVIKEVGSRFLDDKEGTREGRGLGGGEKNKTKTVRTTRREAVPCEE